MIDCWYQVSKSLRKIRNIMLHICVCVRRTHKLREHFQTYLSSRARLFSVHKNRNKRKLLTNPNPRVIWVSLARTETCREADLQTVWHLKKPIHTSFSVLVQAFQSSVFLSLTCSELLLGPWASVTDAQILTQRQCSLDPLQLWVTSWPADHLLIHLAS